MHHIKPFRKGNDVNAAVNSIELAQAAELTPQRRRPGRRMLLSAGVAIAIAAAGAFYLLSPRASESTDDAYVAADASEIAPRIRGLVAEVLVRDNQPVRTGDPLVRIDAEEYDSRTDSAAADLAEAQADVASASAALASLNAEESLAAANVRAAGTDIRATAAEAERADADRRRYEALAANGFATRRDLESRRSAAVGAEQAALRSRALLAVSERQAGVTSARRSMLEAALARAEAHVQRSRAAVALAGQDRRDSLVRAPIDGIVGNRQVQRGDYVQPGSRLLTLVPIRNAYVTAYFKETQIRRMHRGQPVSIRVEALDGPALTGVVDSLAPGSGSTFALLPFEPGTGSFTRIVQRVPVRIRFDPGQAGLDRLRPGLSVTAKVRVAD
jgi:membrane fusion protein (multidrug efflux system)